MKSKQGIIWSLAVVLIVLEFGIAPSMLRSGSTALAAQTPIPGLPVAIAPINSPFEMPQLQRPSFPDVTFDIRDYGAVQCKWEDKEKHKSTEAIHKAIAACHEGGGGKVLVPRGDWLTGAIHLKSNVNLHVAAGAIVHFSNDLEDYLPVVHVRCEGVVESAERLIPKVLTLDS